MDQETKNRLERVSNLGLYFHDTQPRWEGIPAVKSRIRSFLIEQAKLPLPTPDADRDNKVTTGVRKQAKESKDTARTQLRTELVPVAASLHLWLADPANLPPDAEAAEKQLALAAKLDITGPSRLKNMATLKLLGLAQHAINALDLVPAADLEAFDLSATDTADFEAAAARFGLRRNKPRATAQQLANAAVTLDQQLDVLETFVEGELTKAIDTRRKKDPEFVRGFKQAYKLIDRRGSHAAPTKPAPDAPDAPAGQ